MPKTDDIRLFIDQIIGAVQCASGGGDVAGARECAAATLARLLEPDPYPESFYPEPSVRPTDTFAAAPKPKAKAKRGR